MRIRSGITLIEVLVAIFVAAIGTLSLLVLFPLGALNMAEALRNDRCALAALDAAAIADCGLMTPGISPPAANPPIPFRTDTNVQGGGLSTGTPVYIDAFAVNILGSSTGVGGLGGTAPTVSIARVAPSTVNSSLLTNKFFRLPDDLGYDANGVADTSQSYVNRGGRYTWAYMARTSNTLYPGIADLAVVVYDKRNTSIVTGETCYLPAAPTSGTAWPVGTTSITIQYSGSPLPMSFYSQKAPTIKRGSWILDVSQKDTNSPANDPPDIGSLHSFFYRVVGATDTGTSVVLDLETGLVAAINGATAVSPSTPGIIVVMENVANVYERRTGWQP